jgi:glycosyltransferase involved in cell wall biosynthesis
MALPGISVFFPAYNEESNIRNTASAANAALSTWFNDYEILIIDDGSKDNTPRIIDELARSNSHIRAIHHPVNKGYGAALRTGFSSASKELVFFSDGDGQFDISEIKKFIPLINDADLIIGYRLKRQDPFHRLLFAKSWGILVGLMFGLWVRDIDCAFKLIKKAVLNDIQLTSDGAFISAELLIKAKKKRYTIKQVGVNHYPRKAGKQTGANIKVILRAFGELFKLWRELR